MQTQHDSEQALQGPHCWTELGVSSNTDSMLQKKLRSVQYLNIPVFSLGYSEILCFSFFIFCIILWALAMSEDPAGDT